METSVPSPFRPLIFHHGDRRFVSTQTNEFSSWRQMLRVHSEQVASIKETSFLHSDQRIFIIETSHKCPFSIQTNESSTWATRVLHSDPGVLFHHGDKCFASPFKPTILHHGDKSFFSIQTKEFSYGDKCASRQVICVHSHRGSFLMKQVLVHHFDE